MTTQAPVESTKSTQEVPLLPCMSTATWTLMEGDGLSVSNPIIIFSNKCQSFLGGGGGVTVLQNKTCIFVLTNMSVCQHKNTKLNFMKPSGVVAPGQK